jgi:hypothetical protein
MDERRAALEYDFRTRFQFALEQVGVDMGWGEALRLIRILRADPSSMLAASVEGWDYPLSRGDAALMDLYDLQHASKSSKRPKPYPRPYRAEGKKERRGDAAGRNAAEVLALLRPAVYETRSEHA